VIICGGNVISRRPQEIVKITGFLALVWNRQKPWGQARFRSKLAKGTLVTHEFREHQQE
jgi:hypothetical protein